jgi:hypothetical protein
MVFFPVQKLVFFNVKILQQLAGKSLLSNIKIAVYRFFFVFNPFSNSSIVGRLLEAFLGVRLDN